MLSRDYIGKSIDAMARAIALITGFKAKGLYEDGIKVLKQVSQQHLNIDLTLLADVPYSGLINKLKETAGMNMAIFASTATCLSALGDLEILKSEPKAAQAHYKQALVILRYLQENDLKNYYLARDAEIRWLEESIRQL